MAYTRLTFDEAFDRLIGHEGGFSRDPKDPGNWTGGSVGNGLPKGTKYGIAANTYPDLDIENLTLEHAKEIYYRDWWLKVGGDVLDPAILYQLWTFAINSGMGNAKRALQRAAGAAEDGKIGPITIAKIQAMSLDDLLLQFFAAKIRYYTSLRQGFIDFGRGWMNRVADDLDYAAKDNKS